MTAKRTRTHPHTYTLNKAPPCWLHRNGDCNAPFRDSTGTEFGEWISRIISWYTKGGFTDKRTNKVYTSNHHFNWTNYEVLNEPNLERFLAATIAPPPSPPPANACTAECTMVGVPSSEGYHAGLFNETQVRAHGRTHAH